MQTASTTTEFSIRPATAGDVDALTEFHCASFRPEDHIPVRLGRNYVRATYRWLLTSGQAYCLIAEIEDKLIGSIAVCDGSYTRPMFFACLPDFLRSLLRSPRLIFDTKLWGRLLQRSELSRQAKRIAGYPGFAQLSTVSVTPQWRGAGIFAALIASAEAYSKKRGSLAIRAGIYKSNQRSRRAFAKCGWMEMPELETGNTVFYVRYLDPGLPERLGITAPLHRR